MPTTVTPQVSEIYSRLVIEMRDAQRAENQAKAAYEAVKAKIKNLAKTLEISEIECDEGKIAVWQTEGAMYLVPDKVREILTAEQFAACHAQKSPSTSIRLTLKNQ